MPNFMAWSRHTSMHRPQFVHSPDVTALLTFPIIGNTCCSGQISRHFMQSVHFSLRCRILIRLNREISE